MTDLSEKVAKALAKRAKSKPSPKGTLSLKRRDGKRGAAKKSKKARSPRKRQPKKTPSPAREKMAAGKVPAKTEVDAEAFAQTYVRLGCNGTAAYRELRPEVSDETAHVMAHRMLRKVKVQAILFPLLEGLLERHDVDTAWVLERWYEQAMASPLDYFAVTEGGDLGSFDLSGITAAQRRNLRSIKKTTTTTTTKKGDTYETTTLEVRVVDQQKATEMFAKYLDMLKGKLDPEDLSKIGDMIEQGVRRISQLKKVDARVIEGQFSEIIR